MSLWRLFCWILFLFSFIHEWPCHFGFYNVFLLWQFLYLQILLHIVSFEVLNKYVLNIVPVVERYQLWQEKAVQKCVNKWYTRWSTLVHSVQPTKQSGQFTLLITRSLCVLLTLLESISRYIIFSQWQCKSVCFSVHPFVHYSVRLFVYQFGLKFIIFEKVTFEAVLDISH